jgi:hypothetical protein
MKRLQAEVDRVKREIEEFTREHGNLLPPITHVEVQKKKRKRKKKNEVERNYSCHIDGCQKSYGSENSLNQHMKIKHPEFWHRIKEKEQNLTSVNTFKTPEEVFQKHQQTIMSTGGQVNRNFERFERREDTRKSLRNFREINLNETDQHKQARTRRDVMMTAK